MGRGTLSEVKGRGEGVRGKSSVRGDWEGATFGILIS